MVGMLLKASSVLAKSLAGGDVRLQEGVITNIGRGVDGAGCFLLPVDMVCFSARHCNIRYSTEEEAWVVTDTSTNGTFVNGAKVGKGKMAKLKQGDRLRLSVVPPGNPDGALEYTAEAYDPAAHQGGGSAPDEAVSAVAAIPGGGAKRKTTSPISGSLPPGKRARDATHTTASAAAKTPPGKAVSGMGDVDPVFAMNANNKELRERLAAELKASTALKAKLQEAQTAAAAAERAAATAQAEAAEAAGKALRTAQAEAEAAKEAAAKAEAALEAQAGALAAAEAQRDDARSAAQAQGLEAEEAAAAKAEVQAALKQASARVAALEEEGGARAAALAEAEEAGRTLEAGLAAAQQRGVELEAAAEEARKGRKSAAAALEKQGGSTAALAAALAAAEEERDRLAADLRTAAADLEAARAAAGQLQLREQELEEQRLVVQSTLASIRDFAHSNLATSELDDAYAAFEKATKVVCDAKSHFSENFGVLQDKIGQLFSHIHPGTAGSAAAAATSMLAAAGTQLAAGAGASPLVACLMNAATQNVAGDAAIEECADDAAEEEVAEEEEQAPEPMEEEGGEQATLAGDGEEAVVFQDANEALADEEEPQKAAEKEDADAGGEEGAQPQPAASEKGESGMASPVAALVPTAGDGFIPFGAAEGAGGAGGSEAPAEKAANEQGLDSEEEEESADKSEEEPADESEEEEKEEEDEGEGLAAENDAKRGNATGGQGTNSKHAGHNRSLANGVAASDSEMDD